jgi:hypothetical protein
MGKYSNAFFSETTNIIKAKLYMNVYWGAGTISWYIGLIYFQINISLKQFAECR